MRFMRIVDPFDAAHSAERNDDAEPSIAVNPSNPQEMVITAFTNNGSLTAPDAPLYTSNDRGETWTQFDNVPTNPKNSLPLDQSISFATTSGQLYFADIQGDGTVEISRTGNPSSSTELTKMINLATVPFPNEGSNPDQPWVTAITVVGGPDNGKDRLYVTYNDNTTSAKILLCLDALASPPVFQPPIRLDVRGGGDWPSVRSAPHIDGTVYAGFVKFSNGAITLCRDDNWGKNNFQNLTDPSDNKPGRIITTTTMLNSLNIGNQRVGGANGFDIKVHPHNSDIVYVCWIDNSGPPATPKFTLHVRRSTDRGQTWSGDLLTEETAALSTMAVNERGTLALMYLQLINSLWECHFQTTEDGQTWDDTLVSRNAIPPPLGNGNALGDYMRALAAGPHFYSVFPAVNTPGPSTFFPNGTDSTHTIKFARDENAAGTGLVDQDGTTPVPASVDPFFLRVEQKDVQVILTRDPISQDEVKARRLQPRGTPAGLPIQDAIRVTVDGFTAPELGLVGASSTIPFPAPQLGPGLQIIPSNPVSNTPNTGVRSSSVQGFTFHYDIDFPTQADEDAAFNSNLFSGDSRIVTLDMTVGSSPMQVPASAQITLIKSPNPFMLRGDTSWLSTDLRVFTIRPSQSISGSGVVMGSDPSKFIQDLITHITKDQFDTSLLTDEQATALYTHPSDVDGDVFNFAVAKVHYVGQNNGVSFPVRCFFRMFQAQSTSGVYDFVPGTTPLTQDSQYRRTTNTKGPIPLAGFQGDEYVTIPFFAEPRVDSSIFSMSTQTDTWNAQTFVPNADGSEITHFFGCWLDNNQLLRNNLPFNVLPQKKPASDFDGPFTTAVPIQSLIRGLHQCLIAEVDTDLSTIPLGKDPGNWTRLAQRNIAWSDAGSGTSATTFTITPTFSTLALNETPDELMIDWGNTPSASGLAQIYIPSLAAADIISMATRMHGPLLLTMIDSSTIGVPVGGISYIPVPRGTAATYAGLLSIEMPDGLPKGQVYSVVVRQVTNAHGERPIIPKINRIPQSQTKMKINKKQILAAPLAAEILDSNNITWRKVSGAFQLSVAVKDHSDILPREEGDLAVVKYIGEQIPVGDRWKPIWDRYEDIISGRVTSFGGDPGSIEPSPDPFGGDKDNCSCCCQRRHCRRGDKDRGNQKGKKGGSCEHQCGHCCVRDRYEHFQGPSNAHCCSTKHQNCNARNHCGYHSRECHASHSTICPQDRNKGKECHRELRKEKKESSESGSSHSHSCSFTPLASSEVNTDVVELLRKLGICIENENGGVECVKVRKVVIEVDFKDAEP
jgi:hypothetical protein